ncbi:MAG TPA: hypothetical protein VKA31_06905 [Mariprofundaceae bacterium]|nr:hypothetical protein [Mariprofundaceae bacterium]
MSEKGHENHSENKIILKNTRELCAFLGWSSFTFYNRRDKGLPLPPAVRIPGRQSNYYVVEDVVGWLRKFETSASIPAPTPRRGRGRPTKREQLERAGVPA